MASNKKSNVSPKPSGARPAPPKAQTASPSKPESRTLAIIGPDPQDVSWIERIKIIASGLDINTQERSELAQVDLTEAKKRAKALDERRKEITRPMDQAKRSVMDLFEPAEDALAAIIGTLNGKIVAYDNEQRRIARIANEKAEAETEAKRQADLKLAEKAEARGDIEKADQFRDRAETRVAPVASFVSSVSGGRRSIPETFSWDLLDERKLKNEFTMPDSNKITATVRALHMDAEAVVGVGAIKVTGSRSVRG